MSVVLVEYVRGKNSINRIVIKYKVYIKGFFLEFWVDIILFNFLFMLLCLVDGMVLKVWVLVWVF